MIWPGQHLLAVPPARSGLNYGNLHAISHYGAGGCLRHITKPGNFANIGSRFRIPDISRVAADSLRDFTLSTGCAGTIGK